MQQQEAAFAAVSSAVATASGTNSGPHDTGSSLETVVEAIDVSPSTSAPEVPQECRGGIGCGNLNKP